MQTPDSLVSLVDEGIIDDVLRPLLHVLPERVVLLVGDEEYYARLGFARVPRGKITMPGPVDPDRLLYCELRPGALAETNGRMRRL